MNSEPAQRRAWGTLAQSDIVAAAVELARREGVEALTVRRLADEVGAGRMSLYRHIPDKETLLALVANAIAEESAVPLTTLTGPWQERLRHLAHVMRTQFTTFPGLTQVLMTRSNHGPGGLRIAEIILDTLALAGLSPEAMARYYHVFVDIVLGRSYRETHGDPTSAARNKELLDAAAQSDDVPRLRGMAEQLRNVTTDQVFDDELNMIIHAITLAAETT